MACFQIIIVARPVQIGGHGGDEIAPVLPPVSLAQLDPGNLGNRIPFIGRFKRAGQQRIFRYRLRGVFRVNAGRAEKQQFAGVVAVCGFDHIRLYRKIIMQEVGGRL